MDRELGAKLKSTRNGEGGRDRALLEEMSSGLAWDLGVKGERETEARTSSWVEGMSSSRKGGDPGQSLLPPLGAADPE